MKQSSKVLVYGFVGSLVLITVCMYSNWEYLLEEDRKGFEDIPIPNSDKESENHSLTASPPPPSVEPFVAEKRLSNVNPPSLEYKIKGETILIDGKLPIMEKDHLLKQGLMEHCQTFKCDRSVVFESEQGYPAWGVFAQKMIALFHEENLSDIAMTIDESNRITFVGEIPESSQIKWRTVIEQYGVAYDVNDSTTLKKVARLEENMSAVPASVETVSETIDPIIAAQEKISKLLESQQIHFEHNRARIAKKSQKTLDEVIKTIKDIPDIWVEVNGYTDASGKQSVNRWISTERAKSVKNYLGSKGLNPRNIKAHGYGESNLLYPDKPYNQLNRRVEIVIKRR